MTNNGKIIKDAMGQWKHPGKPTRIPGNDITMMGVNYPVYAKPNKGKGIMMYPGENYTFPKADYVDEYPMMQYGGNKITSIDNTTMRKPVGLDVTSSPEYDLRKAKYFQKNWMESLRYRRMLSKSDPEHFNDLTRNRLNNLETTQIKVSSVPHHSDAGVGASASKTGVITVFPAGRGVNATMPHELSHISDNAVHHKDDLFTKMRNWILPIYGQQPVDEGSRLIPKADQEKIKNYIQSNFDTGIVANQTNPKSNTQTEQFFRYIGEPTETRARLNNIRQSAYERKLYNPFTEKVTPEIYKKLMDTQFETGRNIGYDPLQQLRYTYTDEQIQDLLNSVSKTNNNQDFMNYAKQGGQMIRRADGSYSRRGLWDNIRANKGSGKKPTKEMLEQERKIKAKEMKYGGINNAGFDALPDYVQANIISNMAYGGMAYPFMDEGGEPNGEMAMGQMAAVSDKMSKLLQFIKPEDNLDPWIASKLAVMDHSADAISDYMTYGAEGDEEENEEEEMPEMGNGGYTVTRSNDRKGKTHKVTGPDGTVKYFGDSKLGQHPKDPERKAAFYARHKKNLDGNPFFRAFARATWKDGGSTFSGNAFYQKGGSIVDYLESMGMASDKASRKQLAAKMGIKDYDYSADKNLELLAMMRNQGVKDAPAPSTKSSKTVRREMNIPAMLRPVEQPKKGYLSMFDDLMSSVYSKNKNLESGFVVDKRKNKGYIVRNGKIEKSFPVITGSNAEGTENPYSVSYLDDNPKLRATPAGTYNMKPNKNIYGAPGYNMKPIDAFNEKAPNSRAVAVHTTYDPASRDRLYNMSPQDRYKSYGCINCRPEDIGSMTGKYFPQGDTLMVLDPKKNKYDAEFMDRLKKGKGNERYEMGGMPCYECGGMYAYGGIYIDPAKKGTFKAQATRMGMDVQEAASAILNAPEGKYSPEMRKKANFARNFAKQMGGLVEGAEVEVTPEQAELLRQQGYDFEIM